MIAVLTYDKARDAKSNAAALAVCCGPASGSTSHTLKLPTPVKVATFGEYAEIHRYLRPTPTHWYILDPVPSPVSEYQASDHGWPKPLVTDHFAGARSVEMRFIQPFGDTCRAVAIVADQIEAAIVWASCVPVDPGTSPFKERFDLLVVIGSDSAGVAAARDALRPQQTVVICPSREFRKPDSGPNVLVPSRYSFSYGFFRDSRGVLRSTD